MSRFALLFAFLIFNFAFVQAQPEVLPFAWQTLPLDLPSSVTVRAGASATQDGLPIKAWLVDVDYADLSLAMRAALSTAPGGKEPASALAQKAGALIAVNGGYFDLFSRPARTYSLVKSEGGILAENIARVRRAAGLLDVRRTAFGVRSDRRFALDWIAHRDGEIWGLAAPQTDAAPSRNWWDVPEAIGGGPMLLRDGKAQITYDEEVFFGAGFAADKPYPRTAVGFTADEHLILFVTDGKQPEWSVGLTLPQLAEALRELGCTDAMNLDGGGSTTLVVQGSVLNRPSDGGQRAVTSVLGVVLAGHHAPANGQGGGGPGGGDEGVVLFGGVKAIGP